jgi:hypothetical protein
MIHGHDFVLLLWSRSQLDVHFDTAVAREGSKQSTLLREQNRTE